MKKHILKTLLLVVALVSAVPGYVQAKQVTPTNQTEKTLNITPEKFRDNFNTRAKEIGAPQIKNIKYQDNGKAFTILLDSDFMIIGQVKNKNITHIASMLIISPKNKGKLAAQADALGGIALTVIRALDSNKVNEDRDDVVQNVYDDLLNDPETRKGENRKTGAYGNYYIASTFLPELSSITVLFEPR
ncbi:hypothetical protein I2F27_11235 [Acinetobacter sp. B5B]|nr:hypothetical protein [Acinetobacter baretiae]